MWLHSILTRKILYHDHHIIYSIKRHNLKDINAINKFFSFYSESEINNIICGIICYTKNSY